MNLVLDATVEMVGEEKNEIGMVVRPSTFVSLRSHVYMPVAVPCLGLLGSLGLAKP